MTISQILNEVGKEYMFLVEIYNLSANDCGSYGPRAYKLVKPKHAVDITVNKHNSLDISTPVLYGDEPICRHNFCAYISPDRFDISTPHIKNVRYVTMSNLRCYNRYVSLETYLLNIPSSTKTLKKLTRNLDNDRLIHIAKFLIVAPIVFYKDRVFAYKIVGFVKRDKYKAAVNKKDEYRKCIENGEERISEIKQKIQDTERLLQQYKSELYAINNDVRNERSKVSSFFNINKEFKHEV
ncbi:MAG: hypothetical protein ACRDD8_10540 [Bacteroidales bacterium]